MSVSRIERLPSLPSFAVEWKFVEIETHFLQRGIPSAKGDMFRQGNAAEFLGNRGGELTESAFLRSGRECRQRIGFVWYLNCPQPIVRLPITLLADNWEHNQVAAL